MLAGIILAELLGLRQVKIRLTRVKCMTLAQDTRSTLKNVSSGLRAVAAAVQMAGAGLSSMVVAAVWTAAFSASTQKGDSAVVMTAADISIAEALGAAQNDTVWVKGQAVGTIYASGTLIRGAEHDYVLTVGHAVSFASGNFSPSQMTVGNGTSYLNDLGATTGVSSIYISQSYLAGRSSGLDFAFLQLTDRISGPDLVFKIAPTPEYGSSILFAGYGLPGTMSGEPVVNNGNVMSFYGSYRKDGAYIEANDAAIFTGLNGSGVGSSRDSGGSVKVFNHSTGEWENLGTIVAGSAVSTTFLNYNNADAEFNNYLINVVQPVVPEPSISMLAAFGVGLACARRSRQKAF